MRYNVKIRVISEWSRHLFSERRAFAKILTKMTVQNTLTRLLSFIIIFCRWFKWSLWNCPFIFTCIHNNGQVYMENLKNIFYTLLSYTISHFSISSSSCPDQSDKNDLKVRNVDCIRKFWISNLCHFVFVFVIANWMFFFIYSKYFFANYKHTSGYLL